MVAQDYIKTRMLDLNIGQMTTSCYEMYDIIKENFSENRKDYNGQSTMTTSLYGSYNVLLYPLPQFWELYQEISMMFANIVQSDEPHYIQAWLNVYRKGEFIDWHHHWQPEAKSYHGFYCVDTEPSKTSYKIPGIQEIVDVPSKNNLLVMSKSDGDVHRTWEWNYERPRITIAFDILPASHISDYTTYPLNHWMPI